MRARWVVVAVLALCAGRAHADGTAAPAAFREGAEALPFQAEVSRLMDIIVHSLYSNKDVFLRELVSNAADALDKARFLSLTNTTALGPTSAAELPFEIRISADPAKRILTIRDTGIGMTREELVANLGTIAKSGTAAFLEAAQKGGDLNLIGQFGVGFYSAYLVADYVEVVSRRGGEPQHVWESRAGGEFAVSADPKGEDLGRGTAINLHLKAEAAEYLQEAKLRELVQRYSEFISFPIKLAVEKTTTREEPIAEEEAADAADADADKGGADAAVEEEEDDAAADSEEKKPKTRTVTETSTEWETLNAAQALWLRPPGEVDDAEYNKFFKALAGSESEEPLAHAHFRAEGDVDFKAVLYVPTAPPPDLYDAYYTKKPRLRLYVRRVFIADSFEELLPKWLSWLVGLVDSDSMPLNVSREVLQMSEGLKVIRKKLVRKALEMVRKLSDADAAEAAGEASGKKEGKKGWFGGKGGDKGKDGGDAKSASAVYADFWGKFGKALKMGVIEDASNRRRLLPLLRFQTSASGGNLTTLDAYVSRMKANQTSIFYLVGTGGAEELAKSPFVDNLAARGYEVVLFTDPLDEYMMGHVTEYEDKPFANASKDDFKLEDSADDKAKARAAAAHFKGLAAWWKTALGPDSGVSAVKVSRRLAAAPCVLVAGKYGWSATMERIARAQALGDGDKAAHMRGQRTLEVNPRHPLVLALRARWAADAGAPALADAARALADACAVQSGFLLPDAGAAAGRVLGLVAGALGVDDLAPIPFEDEDYPPVPEPAPSKGASGSKGFGKGLEGMSAGLEGLEGMDLSAFEGMDLGGADLGADVAEKEAQLKASLTEKGRAALATEEAAEAAAAAGRDEL